MNEGGSLPESPGDRHIDDLYRVFLSRFDVSAGRAPNSTTPPKVPKFLHLFLEEMEAVGQALETLDGELVAALSGAPGPERWRRMDRWRGELGRARLRLGHIARTLTVTSQEPREWDLAAMIHECVDLLGGEIRIRETQVSITGEREVSPVVLRHPRPEQALFTVLRGLVECQELAGGRITIHLSRSGSRALLEIFAHTGESLLGRKQVPLAGLLPIAVTDGVRIDWEATPGRFALRMEFPEPAGTGAGKAARDAGEDAAPAET